MHPSCRGGQKRQLEASGENVFHGAKELRAQRTYPQGLRDLPRASAAQPLIR
jgi:hypothetical protein